MKKIYRSHPPNETPREVQRLKSVLILEDDPRQVDALRKLFSRRGFEIILNAQDGEEASRIFKRDPSQVDLVCVDREIKAPDIAESGRRPTSGLQGEDFIQLVRRVRPQTMVLVASGREKDRFLGEDLYLEKPFQTQELDATLGSLNRLLNERSSWSPQQWAKFIKAMGDVSDIVADSVVKLSDWKTDDAREYLGMYSRLGLHPTPSYNRDGPVAMVESEGFVVVNLHENLGSPQLMLASGPYHAAHEAMEVELMNNRVEYNGPEGGFDNMPAQIRMFTTPKSIGTHMRETAVEAAITKHFADAVVNEGYCSWLDGNVRRTEAREGEDLAFLAYMQATAEKQAEAMPVLANRLERIAVGYEQKALSQARDHPTVQEFYPRIVLAYKSVFDSVNTSAVRIPNRE